MRTALLATLALALSACGDPLLFAEVEDKQVCITFPQETIPGVDPAIVDLLGERTATWEKSLELKDSIPGLGKKGTTGNIKVISLAIESQQDVSIIRQASVELTDTDPATKLLTYARPSDSATDLHEIDMSVVQPGVDLFPRLNGGSSIPFRATLTGQPPTVDWTAKITACMSVKVQVDPLEMIKK